ncbi:MAG: hypothetical protein HQ596_00425 [Candidatus Saganbacteria bacterium]|nr:hypothetical protein [Candidatus Saganbacteria bacterium]
MNPQDRFEIDDFNRALKEIEQIGRLECLRELEDKIIKEIAYLVEEGTDLARAKLLRLDKCLSQRLDFTPRNRFLISALKNSIAGALSVAKVCL